MQEKEFNLLYEPWILVLTQEGETKEESLLSVLEHAHELRCISGELPTQDVAVLRLLLAVLHATFTRVDVKGNQGGISNAIQALERWENLWELKCFPVEPIKKRLIFYEERFYLFHPERPFYQISGLNYGTSYTATKLLGNLSESGNKVRLFPVRTGDSKRTVSYAEAARWLLYVNAFDDTSGKPSKRGQKMPSPGVGWLGKLGLIYAEGSSLFETLMLNLVFLNDKNEPWSSGKATWEIDKSRTTERVEIPLPQDQITLLTLQSRRLLLHREEGSVSGYLLLGGDFFPKENSFTEQMTLWRKDQKNDIYHPKRHNPSKQLWRDFSSLLASNNGARKPGVVHWLSLLKDHDLIRNKVIISLRTASVNYGDKDFFVTDVFEDSVSINSNILSHLGEEWVIRIIKLLSVTEDCIRYIGYLASDLAMACGDSDSQHHKAGEGSGNAAKAEAYYQMDLPFRKWLADINPSQTDPDEVEHAWKETVSQILLKLGEEMVYRTGEKGITGRYVNNRYYTAPSALLKFRSNVIQTLEKGG
ncbi:MAG TPA: type I-E CRISPR-associated protein Cse1/CasA [Clostridiales bacterium]|nr:type I-E CRISPR-associated protein Cse1/CasA [Clostridiales bacterium]